MDEERGLGLLDGEEVGANIKHYRDRPLPFQVPTHDRMIVRICGKVPDTVLCIEQQIYTYRISEYTEPISYGRFWCFETLSKAWLGLAIYLGNHDVTEPMGWTRAIDFVDGYRVRKLIDGEILVMEPEF